MIRRDARRDCASSSSRIVSGAQALNAPLRYDDVQYLSYQFPRAHADSLLRVLISGMGITHNADFSPNAASRSTSKQVV
jgi:hypothetical protein